MSIETVTVSVKPIFMPVAEACKYVGLGRTSMYELLNANTVRSVKHNSTRLVDVASLEAWARNLSESPLNIQSFANLRK